MLLSHDKALLTAGAAEYSGLHILVTRYNLRTKDDISSEEKKRWLDDRLPLFRDFCLPSVLAQTKTPDLWILGFDGETRDLVEPVLDAVKEHSWIIPAWQRRIGNSYEHWSRAVRRELRPRLPTSLSHVALTRLDNDDALGRTYIEQVAGYSRKVATNRPDLEEFWILFPLGADYVKKRCFFNVYPGNAFPTVVTRRRIILKKERFFVDHSTLLSGDYTVFLPVTSAPMWLRNIHGGAILNSRSGQARLAFVPTRAALRQFGLDRDTLEKGRRGGWRASVRRLLRRVSRPLRSSSGSGAAAES
jgi:hypothetical protein